MEASGNDLLADGRKITGMAFYEEQDNMLMHGTILVDADLEAMDRCLTVSVRKLQSHGIDSVRKRVMNLSEMAGDITVSRLLRRLADRFFTVMGPGQVHWLKETDMPGDDYGYGNRGGRPAQRGGDILLHKGMRGMRTGVLEAEGDITAKFTGGLQYIFQK